MLYSESITTYALVSDAVIDGISEKILKNKAVIVNKSVITAVVTESEIPPEALRIDLPGTMLMPGMINVH